MGCKLATGVLGRFAFSGPCDGVRTAAELDDQASNSHSGRPLTGPRVGFQGTEWSTNFGHSQDLGDIEPRVPAVLPRSPETRRKALLRHGAAAGRRQGVPARAAGDGAGCGDAGDRRTGDEALPRMGRKKCYFRFPLCICGIFPRAHGLSLPRWLFCTAARFISVLSVDTAESHGRQKSV